MTALAVTPTTSQELVQRVAQIKVELNYQFLEREEHIEAFWAALLSRENVLFYGDPGTAKSDLTHAVQRCIVGTKYGWWLMDRQMDKSELLGAYDLPKYKETGEWGRRTKNTLLDSHVVFFDEADKCGSGVKTVTLTAINEHMGKPGDEWEDIPLLTAVGACNDDLEAGDGAWSDRYLVKLESLRLKSSKNFIALLESAVTPRTVANPTTITLDELMYLIQDVIPKITVPSSVYLAINELRLALEAEQFFPSNRRMKKSIRLLQAVAWMDGRDTVEEDDLAILRHVCWDTTEHRQKVAGIVLRHTGPVTRKAIEIMSAISDAQTEIDKLVADNESLETKAAAGGRLQGTVAELKRQIQRTRNEAAGRSRSVTQLDELDAELNELQVQIFVQCMGTPESGARRMVSV